MRFGLTFILLLFHLPFCFSTSIYDTTIKPAAYAHDKYLPLLKGKHVALVINQTSVVGNVSLLDLLISKGVNVTKIFVPEHGFRGREDAGAKVDNSVDSATGIPVISLYGKHKKPTPEDLVGIDVVVYDLQDVGVRFYTYISTMQYCIEACTENSKKFIVLDRPNPNGFYVDGPVLEKDNKSFVGMQCIPIVYGMTAGEYATMLVGEGWLDLPKPAPNERRRGPDVEVIKCINYAHAKKYELPVAPSPNLRTMAAIYAYPSLCLFEGTNISVGRGTDLPFQQYGCPGFEGKYAYSFTPQSGAGAKNPPFENKLCYGEIVGVDEEEVLRKINNSLRLNWLTKAYYLHPEKDKFFNAFFTKLSGTTKLQEQVKNGDTEAVIKQGWRQDLIAFKKIRKRYLLYPDFE